MLMAPVRFALRCAREVEVEMRRQSRRPGSAREDHAQDVCVLELVDERAEGEKLARGTRREPDALPVARLRAASALGAPKSLQQLPFEVEQVVAAGLDPHQQAVESGDVDANRVEPALEGLHERRAAAGKRIEHPPAGPNVAPEELLDELRDELAEIRMEAMDVLRPLALGQLALRPGEVEVDLGVEHVLRDRHRASFGSGRRFPGPGVGLEGAPVAAETAFALDDDVESDGERVELGSRREPRLGSAPDAANLLVAHHLEWITESRAALRFHLAEDEHVPAPRDDVELVAGDPRLRVEDLIAANAIPTRSAALGVVPRLRSLPDSRAPGRSDGGSQMGRRAARRRCVPA